MTKYGYEHKVVHLTIVAPTGLLSVMVHKFWHMLKVWVEQPPEECLQVDTNKLKAVTNSGS